MARPEERYSAACKEKRMLYKIVIKDKLDKSWSGWLGNMKITSSYDGNGIWTTTISGEVLDQPELFGILDRIRDLNLTLISINMLDQK